MDYVYKKLQRIPMKLQDIGEFGLIRRFAPRFLKNLPDGIEGIGDDCAVILSRKGFSTLVTTDMLIENIHFLRSKISPQDLGYKALAVNLSDIAAMGGTPLYAFLSIGLTTDLDVSWIDAVIDGMAALASEEQVLLLGGDTTLSQKDIVLSLTVIGEMESTKIKRRSQAKIGDIVCCTGFLGDSAAGSQALLLNLPADELLNPLITAHNRPRPHTKEGRWLADHDAVHAMIDVSDGIDSDLRHIMESSHCGICVDLETLPLSDPMKKACERFGWKLRT